MDCIKMEDYISSCVDNERTLKFILIYDLCDYTYGIIALYIKYCHCCWNDDIIDIS